TGITEPTRRRSHGRFLTDIIVELGFADQERVSNAIEMARSQGTTPEQVLLSGGALSDDQLSRAIAERYGLDHYDLSVFEIDTAAAQLISASAAKRYDAVPIAFQDENTLIVVMADPANVVAVDDIRIMTGLEVRTAVAGREDIRSLTSRLNRLDDMVAEAIEEDEEEQGAELVDLRESADDAPVIKLVHSIIAQAVERGASD